MAEKRDEQIAALEAALAEKDQVIDSLIAAQTVATVSGAKVIVIDGKNYLPKYPTITHGGVIYTVEQIEADPELAQALLDLDCGVLEPTV